MFPIYLTKIIKTHMWSLQSFSNRAGIFSLSPNSFGCKFHFRTVHIIFTCCLDSQTPPLVFLLTGIRLFGLKAWGYNHEKLYLVFWPTGSPLRPGQLSHFESFHSQIYPLSLKFNKFQVSIPSVRISCN